VAVRRESEPEPNGSRRRPATTPDGREKQLIAIAVDLAEKQILAGTASAQVITHYLKLGSSREQLEQQRIRHENDLMAVKRDAIAKQEDIQLLFAEATRAMTLYKGEDVPVKDEYDDF
jgi:hypothetical protein